MAVVVNELLTGVFTDETYKLCSFDHDSPGGRDVYLMTIHPIDLQLLCFGRVGWSHRLVPWRSRIVGRSNLIAEDIT